MKSHPSTNSKIRILIVEDDEDDALIIKKMLSGRSAMNNDYVVEHCDNAEDAIAEMNSRNYDVYLIDYRLGGMTGVDILKLVKPELRTEPFILMTGADDEVIQELSMDAAAADFIVKGTFTANSLIKTINFALQRKMFERQRLEHLMEINRSKDEFISIASHQLRTPATAVKQYIGMLREGFCGELTDIQQEILEKAHENNERQLAIVTDLLKVARVDAGKVMLQLKEVELGQFVRQAVDDLTETLRDRNQVVTVEAPDTIRVEIDVDTMRMVLDNIIENASKYSANDTEIAVRVTQHDTEACIEIADNGVGVEEGDVQYLFEKFRRIPNQFSTSVGGTGLGLYWAKKIVDLHDGTIEYKANKPNGSKFTIHLPR